MRHVRFLAGAALGIVLSVIVSISLSRAAPEGDAGKSLKDRAEARVQAAEAVVKFLIAREEAGEALTPSFLNMKSECQRRLCDAKLAASETDDQREAAIQEYLAAARMSEKVVSAIKDGNPKAGLIFAGYDIADAEYRLAQLNQK
jgi:hypothetical protein